MKIEFFVFAAAAVAFAAPVSAQTATPTVIDCGDPTNAEHEACLPGIAGGGVTNFAPLIASAAGVLGVAVLAGGGSTNSTTSTTTTN